MLKFGKSSRKIVIVIVDFANGGIESFLYNMLACMLPAEKMQVTILCNRIKPGDRFSVRLKKLGVHIQTYGGCLCYSPFFYLPRLFLQMRHMNSCDILYANAGLLNGFVLCFGHLFHVQHRFSHLHAQEQPSGMLQRLKKWICVALIRRFSTGNFAPSRRVFDCFTPPVLPRQIIKNGIIPKNFAFRPSIREEIRAQLGVGDKLLIGHVGRFDKVKNHAFLVRVFSQIHQLYPQSALLLIGSGEYLPAVEQDIRDLCLVPHTTILTSPRAVAPYYQAMDAFVFPSFKEGLGIVAVEAQCSGLPCFISDGVPDEAMICNATKIPLSKSAKEWAALILEKTKDFKRKDESYTIRQAGFDIQNTIEQIKEYYQ